MATMMIWELNEAYWERGLMSAAEYARQLEPARKATRRRSGFLRWLRAEAQWKRMSEERRAR
jgi:hypothetical protein